MLSSNNHADATAFIAACKAVWRDGVGADVTCFGRFYDLLERRDGRWASSCAGRSTSAIASTAWTPPRR